MPLGVVLERREIDNPWQSVSWRAVAVIPGAPELDEARQLRSDEGVPMVYVVLRFDDDDEGDEDDDGVPRPFLVTACPFEAAAYLDATATGEMIERVPMPEAVRAWVQEYVAKHHVDEPVVKKRKRKKWFEQHERNQEQAHGLSPASRGKPRHD